MQEIKNISFYRQSLKDRILDTSMILFAEKGIKAVKMDDIATRLSISKRTLYEIYKDKEGLLFEGVKKYHSIRRERVRQVAHNSSNVIEVILFAYREQVEAFRLTNPLFYSDMERYPKIVKYFEEENKSTRSLFLDFLRRGVDEGYFRDDINYELIAHMFEALGKYIMSNQLYSKYTIEDLFMNILFVSLRGFCTERGSVLLDHHLNSK